MGEKAREGRKKVGGVEGATPGMFVRDARGPQVPERKCSKRGSMAGGLKEKSLRKKQGGIYMKGPERNLLLTRTYKSEGAGKKG